MPDLKTEKIQKLIVPILGLVAILLVLLVCYVTKITFHSPTAPVPSTISVSATGEAKAVPDIATFSFSAIATGKDVAEAQNKMADIANKAIAYLKSQGIDEKDIQTTGYSANPEYDYTKGTPSIIDYQARETITVKVRDQSKAGAILSGVGSQGVSEISGLSFESDDPDTLKAQATEDAINKAKQKAETLADQVGFRLVRIVGYSEDGSQVPYPIPFADKAVSTSAVVPEIQPGENTTNVTVTLTYEIR